MGFKNILWQGSSLKQDASNRLVTDKEKTIWNNKANNSHTHAKSDIKDFPSSLPASDVYAWAKASSKPSYSWSEITNKPSTFNPSSHNHDYLTLYSGRPTNINFNKSTNGAGAMFHFVATSSTTTGKPPEDSNVLQLNWDNDGGYDSQLSITNCDGHMYFRGQSAGNWNNWKTVIDSSNIGSQSVNYANSAGGVAWGNVSGKPSTFTPSSHTHTKSQIKDFPSSLPASDVYSWAKASSKPSYAWSEITSKPSTFTPSSHTHTKSQVGLGNVDNTADSAKSVKYATSAGSANSVPWSGVTGKPSTFPPSSHSHSYVPLSGGTMTGTLSLKNTGLQIISNLPEDFSGTPRGDRQVLWYSKEFEDDSYKYEDYCEHYINLGTPNSGAGNGKFGATVQVRFYKENANCHTDVHINDGVTSNISVVLPVKSGTLQVSSSDVKLKTNITDTEVDDAISFINKIHLHSFDWKTDDTHQPIGFIADELEELDERLSVGGNSDKVDENGLPIDPKCVNTFYLQGYEVKAIQELSSKVDALEKENEELKSRLTKLEDKLSKM